MTSGIVLYYAIMTFVFAFAGFLAAITHAYLFAGIFGAGGLACMMIGCHLKITEGHESV